MLVQLLQSPRSKLTEVASSLEQRLQVAMSITPREISEQTILFQRQAIKLTTGEAAAQTELKLKYKWDNVF